MIRLRPPLFDRPAVATGALACAVAVACAVTSQPFAVLSAALLALMLLTAWRREHVAMLLLATLAAGFDPVGLLGWPVAIGFAIARKVPARTWAGGVTGIAIAAALRHALPATPAPERSIWHLVAHLPLLGDQPLDGLALATVIGLGAALTAWLTTIRAERAAIFAPAFVTLATLAAVSPSGPAPLLPLLCLLALGDALHRRTPAAWQAFSAMQAAAIVLALGAGGMTDAAGFALLALAIRQAARPLLARPANDNAPVIGPALA